MRLKVNMSKYEHRVSGFFVKREEADIALAKIVERGLPSAQMHIYTNDNAAPTPAVSANSNAVLNDIVVDGAIGTAIGAGLGVLGEVALIAANVTLFVASPLIAPLVMLGWGASLGAVAGAVAGAVNKEPAKNKFSDLVCDAILNGQVVLVVTTFSEAETRTAADVLQVAVGSFKDEAAATV